MTSIGWLCALPIEVSRLQEIFKCSGKLFHAGTALSEKLPFAPEAQRPPVGDGSEGADRSQEEQAADDDEDGRQLGPGGGNDELRHLWCNGSAKGEHQQSGAGEEFSDIFRVLSAGEVVGEGRQTPIDQRQEQERFSAGADRERGHL